MATDDIQVPAPEAVLEETAEFVGRSLMDWVAEVGAISRFLARGARATRTRLPRRGRLLVQQMTAIGIDSIPLVLVTSLFVGAVAAVQAAYQMHNLTPLRMIPTVIGRSAVIELGPVLTALV